MKIPNINNSGSSFQTAVLNGLAEGEVVKAHIIKKIDSSHYMAFIKGNRVMINSKDSLDENSVIELFIKNLNKEKGLIIVTIPSEKTVTSNDIKELLNSMGFQPNDESLLVIRYLFKYGLAITKENIQKMLEYSKYGKNYDLLALLIMKGVKSEKIREFAADKSRLDNLRIAEIFERLYYISKSGNDPNIDTIIKYAVFFSMKELAGQIKKFFDKSGFFHENKIKNGVYEPDLKTDIMLYLKKNNDSKIKSILELLLKKIDMTNIMSSNSLDFQVPLLIDDKWNTLDITIEYPRQKNVLQGESAESNEIFVQFSMVFSRIDVIQCFLDVNKLNSTLDCIIYTKNDKVKQFITEQSGYLKERLSNFGYKTSLSCITQRINKEERNKLISVDYWA